MQITDKISVDLSYVDCCAHEATGDRSLLGFREWDVRRQMEVPSLEAVGVITGKAKPCLRSSDFKAGASILWCYTTVNVGREYGTRLGLYLVLSLELWLYFSAAFRLQLQKLIGAVPGGAAYASQSVQSEAQPANTGTTQSPEGLQQLVAPIALYPDALVSQILAGATYPTEIVEANRWMQGHPNLKGQELANEVDKQP